MCLMKTISLRDVHRRNSACVRSRPKPGTVEAQVIDDLRLRNVNQQLESIAAPVLSEEARELIRRAAAAWALWLELDDELDEMGLTVAFGGGIEYPPAFDDGVAVVQIDGVKIGGLSISRET